MFQASAALKFTAWKADMGSEIKGARGGRRIVLKEISAFIPLFRRSPECVVPALQGKYPVHWFLRPYRETTPTHVESVQIRLCDAEGRPIEEFMDEFPFLGRREILAHIEKHGNKNEFQAVPLQRAKWNEYQRKNGLPVLFSPPI